jgi:osmotically-inducible protein OsmY
MMHQEKVKDTVISQKVKEKLSSIGIRAPSHVTALSNNGQVTVSGSLQYEHQRHVALRAIKSVTGVQRVVDQMRLIPSAQHQNSNPRGNM